MCKFMIDIGSFPTLKSYQHVPTVPIKPTNNVKPTNYTRSPINMKAKPVMICLNKIFIYLKEKQIIGRIRMSSRNNIEWWWRNDTNQN